MACGSAESGWGSPRFSFSVNLSSTDTASPEKRKLKDLLGMDCSTEFEFSIASNVNVSVDFGDSLVFADDLFVDGKILPQIPRLRPQNVKADQLSTHSPPISENSSSKSSRKLSSRWKRFFKLKKHKYFRIISKEAHEYANESSDPEVKPQRSRKLKGLFSVFPFLRKKSAAQRKSVEVQFACRETDGDLIEVEDSRNYWRSSPERFAVANLK